MNDKKYLLREYYALCEGGVCEDFLTESEKKEVKDGKTMILTGVMQRAGQKNGNGRIYPKGVLEKTMKDYQKLIDENRALGECDHPETSVVELKNVSHMLVETWWKGDDLMGKIKLLATPMGQILMSLIQAGVQLGISSRGLGSVKEQNGDTIVEDDYCLVCFDVVSDPSTSGAFMNLKENKIPLDKVFKKADRINRKLNAILDD